MTLMDNRAKKHHIVPQVLQKQFAIQGDQQRIWRTKREACSRSFQSLGRKRIAKTFVINDYYTVLENDQRSDLIEREFYAKIDDFLGRILPEIIQILNSGSIPEFSPESLDAIREVTMHMAKRTPDFEEHDDIALGRELVETTLQDLSDQIPLARRKQLEADLTDDVRLRDKGRDIRVTARIENSQRVNEALSQLVPRWAISETKHSFILASRMVYRIGNGGPNGLSNPKMEMWMPITPKIALVLVRDPGNRIPHRVVDTPDHIRRINEYAVRNSFEVASHSEALLKSLVGKVPLSSNAPFAPNRLLGQMQ
ncbi:MAG: DUF4238 domain-containing protein [Robiginitomaculum sp.]